MTAANKLFSNQILVPQQKAPAWVGTREHFRWVVSILQATVVMNVLDAIFTLVWVYTGKATEANPLMASIIDSPLLFISVKLALVSMGSFLLWRCHKKPFAIVGIVAVFLVYYSIILYHLRAWDLTGLLS